MSSILIIFRIHNIVTTFWKIIINLVCFDVQICDSE